MKSWLRSFNVFLLAALAAVAGGCDSGRMDMKKEYATLRVYMEAQSGEVALIGPAKIPMFVESDPILTEEDVSRAKLVDEPDGSFEIQVTFTDDGSVKLLLETAANGNKHLAVFSHFPPKGWQEPRDGTPAAVEKSAPGQPRMAGWLDAPLIRSAVSTGNGISSGSIRFKTGGSREEAEQIVRGLNNNVSRINKME